MDTMQIFLKKNSLSVKKLSYFLSIFTPFVNINTNRKAFIDFMNNCFTSFLQKVAVLFAMFFLSYTSTFAQCGTPTIQITPDINPANRCIPAANFSFRIIGAPSGVLNYSWNYGDGLTGITTSIFSSHVYTTANTFTVSVTVTLQDGTVCTPVTGTVLVLPLPLGTFSTDTNYFSCTGSLAKTFTVNEPNPGPVFWRVTNLTNPGAPYLVSGPAMQYFFNQTGNYEILLQVNDINGVNGCYTIKIDTISILLKKPITGSINPSLTTKACLPMTRTFTPNINLNGNLLDSLVWTIPGSNIGSGVINASNLNPQTLTYTTQGKYDFAVKAYSGTCSYTIMNSVNYIYVEPQPYVRFSLPGNVNSISTCAGDTIVFTNTTPFGSTYDTTKFIWTTTGGSAVGPQTWRTIKRVYNTPGSYNVRLAYGSNPPNSTVACFDDTIANNVIVINGPTAQISPTMIRTNCGPPFLAQFLHSSTVPPTGTNTFLWRFYYSDGKTVRDSSTFPNPSFLYDSIGSFRVSLTLKNSSTGCTSTTDQAGWVKIGLPDSDLSNTPPAPGCASQSAPYQLNTTALNLTVNFNGYIYNWKVIDASGLIIATATGRTPTINITKPGVYSLRLITSLGTSCIDSVTKVNYIVVNGITGFTQNTVTSGDCLPATKSFNISAVTTLPASSTMTYSWSSSPNGGITISNPTAATTNITFTQRGFYTVECIMVSAEGCSTTVSYPGLYFGTQAAFNLNPSFCKNTTTQINNNSSGNCSIGCQFLWSSNAPGAVFSSTTVFDPTITIPTVGNNFEIKLIITNDNGCKDTTTQSVSVYSMQSSFAANQTLLSCAPKAVVFGANSSNVASYQWIIIDSVFNSSGILVPDTNFINSSDTIFWFFTTNGYKTIGLIVTSADGCADTLIKQNYINIDGPVVRFTALNKKGCEPLTVSFVDQSLKVSSPIVDWGNGATRVYTVGGTTNLNYFYPYQVSNADSFQYFMSLTASGGSANCSFTKRDTITVYPRPDLKFNTNDTVGCAPLTVNFTDNSRFVSRYSWDFGDPNTIADTSNLPNPTYTFTNPGTYQIRLRAFSKNSCFRDSTWTKTIVVNPVPSADFETTDTIACFRTLVSFRDKSISIDPLSSWSWDFGDPNTVADTSNQQNPSYTYLGPGSFNVRLTVTTSKGCINTIIKNNFFRVLDTLPPPNAPIRFISVVGNNVDVNWNQSALLSYEFKEYVLSNGGTVISNIGSQSILNYTHINPASSSVSQCYKIQVRDNCNRIASQFIEHCTVYLDVTSSSFATNTLNWSPYVGWANVKEYRIYRAEESKPFVLISTVPGSVNLYDDQNLCNINYCYYIVAVNQADTLMKSNSNNDCNIPVYQTSGNSIDFKRATVEGNRTRIDWNSPLLGQVKYYIIDKYSERTNFWVSPYDTTSNKFYYDNNVNTVENTYAYRVRYIDGCGNRSDSSNIGRTMVLKVDSVMSGNEVNVRLKWNSYVNWQNGVGRYEVYFQLENGSFSKIADLIDTMYIDIDVPKAQKGFYCYYVQAVENEAIPDSSSSNVVCFAYPSKLYTPTAFTPNGDGLNDEFYAIAPGMKTFLLQIFDKWGNKVFESEDPNERWTGKKNNSGEIAPPGMYGYHITARGVDGKRFRQSGSFSLMR